MAVRKINESTLTGIADAIRAKTGGSALINPEDMASEIESISTGGGVGENLLSGASYTAGYLDNIGAIAAQSSTNKEVTSGNIPVEAGKTYLMLVATATAKFHWVSIQTLNGSGNIVARRIVLVNAGAGTYNCGAFYTIPSGVAFVRVSFRTHGNADAYFGEIGIDSIDFENVTQ